MSVRTRVCFLTAAIAASTLVLAGCGGPSLPSVFNAPPPSTSAGSQAVLPGGSSDSGGPGSGGAGIGTFSSDCLGVASAYSSIALALLPSLGGSGTYNSDQVAQAISGLGGSVPGPLEGDFQTLSAAAKSATGKNLADAGQILGSPAVSAASDDISKWMTANCGG